MTQFVAVPASLTHLSVDQLAAGLPPWPPQDRLVIDAHATEWASPAGFVALLTLGQALADLALPKPDFTLPEADGVSSYWAKVGWIEHAEQYFRLLGKVSRRKADEVNRTIVPLTSIRNVADVHDVVGRLTEHATDILKRELELEPSVVGGFGQSLSEACQNIVEHSGTSGWVAAHVYVYRRRLGGRKVAVIAVSDAGIGFRRSLDATQRQRFGDRWTDAQAIETALIQNVSRFRDPGRGQGFSGIKGYLSRWEGEISIRSGTGRVAIVPAWDDTPPRMEGLPFFPGSQVTIIIPGKEPAE